MTYVFIGFVLFLLLAMGVAANLIGVLAIPEKDRRRRKADAKHADRRDV